MTEDILATLNKEQAEAVTQIAGPLLILAGAGSGKTKALTTRIAYLLSQGVKPYNILAITFNNKAAKEMRQRVDKLVGEAAKDVWLYTFTAFVIKSCAGKLNICHPIPVLFLFMILQIPEMWLRKYLKS